MCVLNLFRFEDMIYLIENERSCGRHIALPPLPTRTGEDRANCQGQPTEASACPINRVYYYNVWIEQKYWKPKIIFSLSN
jgi:hypothetical protein